jgi:hypothetical protein
MSATNSTSQSNVNTPTYELDDGPLTDEQMLAIRNMCPQLPASRITRGLFDSYHQDIDPLTESQKSAIRRLSKATETPDELFTEKLFVDND